jgi:hypothetical protein
MFQTFRDGSPCPAKHVDVLLGIIEQKLRKEVSKMEEQKVPASCITFVTRNPEAAGRETSVGAIDYTLNDCLDRAREFLVHCRTLPLKSPRLALQTEAIDGRNTRRLGRILKLTIGNDPSVWDDHQARMGDFSI